MSITGSEQWMYQSAAGFYDFPIGQSLRFEDGDSAYLSRTPSSAGNLDAWTFSAWVKRGNLGVGTQTLFGASSDVNNWMYIGFTSGNTLTWSQADAGSVTMTLTTSQVFRDVGSWYHIVCKYDSAQATAEDRQEIYINGTKVTTFGTATRLGQNADSRINRNIGHTVGRLPYSASGYFDGYMSEVNFIDGTALDASSFGETKSGIWVPKDPTGLTFGTNGFRLEYADSAAIGDDTSGNTNDWTANNLVASDVVLDSPTNNFAVIRTMNDPEESGVARAEGNLKYTTGSGTSARNSNKIGISNILPSTGKWYAEVRIHNTVSSFVGVGTLQGLISPTSNNTRYAYIYATDGNSYVRTGASESISTHGAAISVGDVVGIYVDMDASTPELYFSKNGQWSNGSGSFNQSTPTSAIALGDTFFTADTSNENQLAFHCSTASSGASAQFIWNFGQDSTFSGNEAAGGNADANGIGDFYSAVPDDALALCTSNLPTGAIDTLNDETPEDYFNTVLYTGTGANNSITGVGFQTDFLWLKQRNAVDNHVLFDVVRGGPSNELYANLTNAEAASTGALISYDSDGFTLGANGDLGRYNENGSTYAAWNWKANGAGVSNTDGTITSTVSANQTSGFSVATYTGDGSGTSNFGHGLSAKPEMIIIKNRTGTAYDWKVFHHNLSTVGYILKLNSTAAEVNTGNTTFGNPTSSLVVVKNNGTAANATNISGVNYVAYCFHSVEGFSKVGSYRGNGSSDGPFVFTGFRPAFILTKRYDGVVSWPIWDNRRDGYNTTNKYLLPNLSNAESSASSTSVDFLSNGFKFRGGSAIGNLSGGNYIYLAIAEQPYKFANAR